MKSTSKLMFFLGLVLVFTQLTMAAQRNLIYHLCVVENGNFTTNSTYQTNRNQALTSLYTNTSVDYGFYTSTYGEAPNELVAAMAQCRPDMDAASCLLCINKASEELTNICTNTEEAIGGYEDGDNYCMLRYANANREIFNRMENAPYFFVYSTKNITDDLAKFKQGRHDLLESLISPAAAGNSYNKSSSGQEAVSNMMIYAYVQCTPDLTKNDCNTCLQNATARLSQCCDNDSAGRVIYPSCNFRYAINRILKEQSTSAPETPGTPPTGKGSSNIIIIIVSVSVATLAILVFCIFIYLRTRKPNEKFENVIEDIESLQYDLSTIKAATNNFSEANKLGQGGFGIVYKGMLSSGQLIAVKRLLGNATHGDREFKNEVSLVARLQHRNLVRLIGFCLELSERLLILEFVPNSSLDHYIFDPIKRIAMGWTMRYKIVTGIARGLLYLHEDSRLRIVHRDLKAGNILLDSEMNPKIADFGTARLFEMNQTQENTANLAGTFGYMAPEYVLQGRFSVKSDVFSFGVLVLETINGQKRQSFRNGEDEEDLLTFAWESWNLDSSIELVDPHLRDSSSSEMMRCIQIALLCVQENEADRPSMASVVLMLSSESLPLSAPLKPEYNFMQRFPSQSVSMKTGSTKGSTNGLTISDFYPR